MGPTALQRLERPGEAPAEDAVLLGRAAPVDDPPHLELEGRLPVPGRGVAEGHGRGARHRGARGQPAPARVHGLDRGLEARPRPQRPRAVLLPRHTVVLSQLHLRRVTARSAKAPQLQAADKPPVQRARNIDHGGGMVAVHQHGHGAVPRHAGEDVVDVTDADDSKVANLALEEVRWEDRLVIAFMLRCLEVINLEPIARK
mmetsp:Transcript_31263/g.89664  ORF Transcript_31263/g.89664 Transcript_31263/m.89664 type:complete len:201 (-) Transcript_31263:353-955(-)